MICNYSALREKDVVNVCDGRRLGYICDFSVDTDSGRICAVFVSNNYFGLGGRKGVIRIDWCNVSCIGEDTILVRIEGNVAPCDDDCREKKKRRGWL